MLHGNSSVHQHLTKPSCSSTETTAPITATALTDHQLGQTHAGFLYEFFFFFLTHIHTQCELYVVYNLMNKSHIQKQLSLFQMRENVHFNNLFLVFCLSMQKMNWECDGNSHGHGMQIFVLVVVAVFLYCLTQTIGFTCCDDKHARRNTCAAANDYTFSRGVKQNRSLWTFAIYSAKRPILLRLLFSTTKNQHKNNNNKISFEISLFVLWFQMVCICKQKKSICVCFLKSWNGKSLKNIAWPMKSKQKR